MRPFALFAVRLAVIAALAAGSGAHWVVLQSVAWATMLVEYSHDAPLTEAVAKTFDGRHPCELCLTIEGGEKQQKERQAAQPVPEIKGVLAPTLHVAEPAYVSVEWTVVVESAVPLTHAPPVPPPRAA